MKNSARFLCVVGSLSISFSFLEYRLCWLLTVTHIHIQSNHTRNENSIIVMCISYEFSATTVWSDLKTLWINLLAFLWKKQRNESFILLILAASSFLVFSLVLFIIYEYCTLSSHSIVLGPFSPLHQKGTKQLTERERERDKEWKELVNRSSIFCAAARFAYHYRWWNGFLSYLFDVQIQQNERMKH